MKSFGGVPGFAYWEGMARHAAGIRVAQLAALVYAVSCHCHVRDGMDVPNSSIRELYIDLNNSSRKSHPSCKLQDKHVNQSARLFWEIINVPFLFKLKLVFDGFFLSATSRLTFLSYVK